MSETPAERVRTQIRQALPTVVAQTMREDLPEPAPGQIWRARWQDAARLVLILAVRRDRLDAAAVTLDPDSADDHAAVVDPDHTTLGMATAIWFDDHATLPMRVLDRFAGRVVGTAQDLPAASALIGWLDTLARGGPVHTPADPRALTRAELLDALDTFAEAAWVNQRGGDLRELLRGASLPEVVAALGDADPRNAMSIMRGQRGITVDQARALGRLLGREPEELMAANPALPPDLVAVFDRPATREKVVALAARRGADEISTRRNAAYDVYGMAARQAGHEPDWTARSGRYFDIVLGGEQP